CFNSVYTFATYNFKGNGSGRIDVDGVILIGTSDSGQIVIGRYSELTFKSRCVNCLSSGKNIERNILLTSHIYCRCGTCHEIKRCYVYSIGRHINGGETSVSQSANRGLGNVEIQNRGTSGC